MFGGCKEVQADDKVLFFLEDSAGDETLVATGHESADGEFTFVGNIAEPFVTRSKQKLLEWIQQITVRLNMPTEARPNKMMAQNDIPASPGQSSPLTLSPETSHPSHPEDNANNSSGDAESNGGGASMDHDAQPSGSGEIDAKAGTAMAEDGPSGEPGSSGLSEQKFAFVSYREEVRGFSDPFQGEVPRRMKHWLLKDSRGREHTAVNTIKWEPKKKRFTYEAVAPFSDVRPLRCHNQRLVLEYLDQFVPPKARQADTLPDRSPAVPNGPPKPATAKNGAGSKDKSTSHGGPLSPKSHQAAKPKAHSAGKSSMTSELRLAAAKHELDMLHSQFGMQYSLTLISPNQQVKVLTSASVVSTGGQAVGLSSLRFDDCEVHRDGQTGGSQELAELGALDLLTAMATAGRDDADAKKGKKGSKRRSGDAERAEAKRAKQEPEDPLVASVMAAMESNTKMYMPGTWRREPFQSHPLTQEIDDFLLAEDCGEALDREMLSQKLSVRLPCTGGGGPGSPAPSPGPNDVMIVLDSLPKPVRSTEVDLQPVWGLDSYTRSLLASALESCTATPDQAARDAFIQKELLPTLNSLGEDGWDLFKALKAVEKRSTSPEARLAAQHTLHVLTELEKHTNDGKDCPPNGREWSRVHCKGTGVVLKRKAGLPAGTFVGEYLGELCTAWRWAEREGKGTRGGVGTGASASKGRNAWRMGASPDFYNIALERPKADTRGYDVLYVDAVHRSNFVSRLNHSCDPNCRSITVVAGGRLTLGVWTTRPVAAGEELTLDFAGETEIEREAQLAVCLCGAASCRQSFLYLAPGPNSPLRSVLTKEYTFLDRMRRLVEVITHPELTAEDQQRLTRHGFKELILHDGLLPEATQVPQWLRKWVSDALAFVEHEEMELRKLLLGPRRVPLDDLEEGAVEEEIKHMASNRVHSLAVAVDRAKLFLRHQPEALKSQPPLRVLRDDEVVQYLWSGDDSVATRVITALSAYIEAQGSTSLAAKRSARRIDHRSTPWYEAHGSDVTGVKDENLPESTPAPEGNDGTGTANGGASSAALTELLESLTSMMEERDVTTPEQARTALRDMAAALLQAGPMHAGVHDVVVLLASTEVLLSQTQYESFSSALSNGSEGMRYRAAFLWGLLCEWHRALSDPVDSLVAERRVSVCLPDIETCYMPYFVSGKYPKGERATLLKYICAASGTGWTKSSSFTFRNPQRIFGSPLLDAALKGPDSDSQKALEALIEEIQEA